MNKWIWIVLAVVLAIGAGVWIAAEQQPHQHELVQKKDEQGQSYWTCAMHPEVRRDGPGQCPICGMALIEREEQPASAEAEILYWYDPMRPDVHFDAPGKSPFMDMELVPKYAEAKSANSIRVDPAMVQNLGIRTAPVKRGTFWQRIDTVGELSVNPHRQEVVEARVEAWVGSLRVHAEGEAVQAGQTLAELDAPVLLAAREEYRLARQSQDAALIRAARTRLQRLGLSADQIDRWAASSAGSALLPLPAPISGVVTRIDVHPGARVGPKMPLMTIADLSELWVTVEVPEAQLSWIEVGRPADVRLPAFPAEVIETRIDYIFPKVDPQSRTGRVRLILDNSSGKLQPGMVADVALFGGPRHEVLLVPSDAVIRTGTRNVVMLDEGQGRYRPQHVEVGAERLGQAVIESGLQEGQQVVVSGQFLIDSEASLQGAYRRMGGDGS